MERALGVVIGLGATYLFFSVVVLAIVETLSGILAFRSKDLKAGLQRMLDVEAFQKGVLEHRLVVTLGKVTGRKNDFPSYIPTPIFARAFLDTVGDLRARKDDVNQSYQDALKALPEAARPFVEGIVGKTLTTVEAAEQRVGQWFDAAMNRLSSAYKRRAQVITTVATLAVVMLVNVDSMSIGAAYWRDPIARDASAQAIAAEIAACKDLQAAKPNAAPTPQDQIEQGRSRPDTACPKLIEVSMKYTPVPVGWTHAQWHQTCQSPGRALTKLIGLILTVIAVSLGAPFWFDVIRRVAPTIAGGGPKPKPHSPGS